MASRATDFQKKPIRTEPGTEPPAQPVTDEAIAIRAYELWELRGSPIGSAEIDWFEAEQELRSRAGNQKRAPESERRPRIQDSTGSVGATEDQVNSTRTVPERVDKHGSKIEEAAGTGEHDSLGG